MDDIKDVVPGLLERIQKDFKEQFSKDSTVIQTYGKMKSKMATYKEANEFSIRVGEMLANSFSKFLTPDSLPDGRMYYNIATRILEPTLHTNYSLITDVCKAAQTKINKDAGIGLKVIKPAFNKDRLKGLEDKVSNAEQFEDVQWVLKEPVVNFSQSIVDDSIKDNAEFHYKSGLTPKIRRTAESGCCKWCANLEGEYEYPYVPSNVYRKHENCRCVVEYIKDGKYTQNVHSKQWVGDVPPQERQKQILKQEKASQAATKRENEKQAVQALMKAHPDWTEEGATIYYRTHGAKDIGKMLSKANPQEITPQQKELTVYGNKNTTKEHKTFSANGPEVIEYLQENTGVSFDRAKEYKDAVYNFTGENGNFAQVREYQQGIYKGNDIGFIASEAETLEDYIFKMPKWGGSETYRGIAVSNSQLEEWLNGAIIDNKGISSWSTAQNVAEDFARYGGSGEKQIVFVSKTQSKGSDIAFLSQIFSEREILVSEKARYVLERSNEIDDIIYLYVKEIGTR